jgi:serine/threonine protein kinase
MAAGESQQMLAGESERLLAGRYRLLAVIGRGGMGAVWRARDELLNRDVAVKEIVWPVQLDTEVREAQLAARVRHPNVVGVYDIVQEGDWPSIVMELVPFRSLRDAVAEDGPMPPAEAARVGLSVLAALRAVHEAGVVHRDVKPANILLGPEGRVVLADFGIAKAADSPALTISGVLLGSPSYLAPERARGGRAGAAADMWALGASLFAAVEGHPPFERDGVLASLTAVVADELEPSPHAGPLWPVIEGLLLKDPAARLDAAGAEQMLHGIAAPDAPPPTEPDHAQEPHPAPQPEPAPEPDLTPGDTAVARDRAPGRSRRFRAGLAVLTAIAVIVAGITIALSRTPGHHAAPQTTPRASAPASQPAPAGRAPSPSSAAPPATSSPSAALPAGYYRFTNSTGFSIGVPRGWQISHDGHYVYIRDPANSGIFLLIDQSDQPKASALADWRQQAANRQGTYPGYHLIVLQSVRYPQAEQAADWEFTYNRNGVTVQVLNRNILANARHAYALYWSTPASGWNAYYHYFQVFAATFRPAPTGQPG